MGTREPPRDGGTVDDFPIERPRRRLIPPGWASAVVAGTFSLASILAAWMSYTEAHRATTLEAETAALDKEVALIESCGEASPALFRVGDDFVILTGSDGNDEFWNSTERDSFDENRPKKPRVLVRCQFTNLSRVPLLSIYVYYRLAYHHKRTVKEKHSYPFALAPAAVHAIWFFNIDKETVVFSTPRRARYTRFPAFSRAQNYQFQPPVRDYWILYRDFKPDEHLDESMM